MIDFNEIKERLHGWNQPDYRYRQLCEAVFQQRKSHFEEMTVFPQNLRNKLIDAYGMSVSNLHPIAETHSQQAEKVLFELPVGGQVETVRLRYKKGWDSYCISSQFGCNFGCRFCATGAMGVCRNLSAEEIAGQLLYFFLKGYNIQSVSFMGMGEPLINPHTFEALNLLTSPDLFGMSQRRITVSTVGVIPGIERLAEEWPQVNLAYSLHAPTPELRSTLMPVERRWPMEQVLDSLDRHIFKNNKRIFLAYTLLRGVNDGTEHAKKLIELLYRHKQALPLYHVDLISYNSTDQTSSTFATPGHDRIKNFAKMLKQAGISCSFRMQFGSDIDAGCGQLYGQIKGNARHSREKES